jgi:uncharacterized protein (TIGR00730 family)
MRRICVFTGSNPGTRPEYRAAAVSLGELLAARDIELVYGGARIGLMGAVADAAMAAGGKAIGVIPEGLKAKEVAHSGLDELHVVGSMHERKAMMAELSDAFIALPGGVGTFEETFEILTWSVLGIHAKPIGLLDVEGYYSGLVDFIEHSVREGFFHAQNAAMLMREDDPERLLEAFESYEPVVVQKWIELDES